MNLKENNNSENNLLLVPILDTVEKITLATIYDNRSPRYKEKFWKIICTNNSFKVFPSIVKDQALLAIIQQGKLLGKKWIFYVGSGRGSKGKVIKIEKFTE